MTALDKKFAQRRENVFLFLSGIFLCVMCILNIVGLLHYVQIGPLSISVGVLAYPLTFFCTDIISELYGKKKARFLVTLGFLLNVILLLYFFLIQSLPPALAKPPWQVITLAQSVSLPNNSVVTGETNLFYFIYACMTGGVGASMLAYLFAQYFDVYIFHWLKQKTKGRHFWLRNNVSTALSQLIDTLTVSSIVFASSIIAGQMTFDTYVAIVISSYTFKVISALVDTPLCYAAVIFSRKYLNLKPNEEVLY